MSTLPAESSERGAYHHGDLRNALIEAGRIVAREIGHDALTLREVARRAGVSHTATYKHFASKRDLLRAIAELAFAEFTAALRGAATSVDLAALERMGAAYVRFAMRYPVEFSYMFNRSLCLATDQPDTLAAASLESKAVLRQLLLSLRASGVIRADDLEHQLLAVWSHIHGLATLIVHAPGFEGLLAEGAEQLARDGVRRMVAGLAITPGVMP